MNNDNQNFQAPTPPAPVNTGKSYSIAGLVLGIVSAVFGWFGVIGLIALVCGVIGIVLAVRGQKMAKAAGVPTGLATAGLVLSIVGTSLAGIGVLSCFICASCLASAASSVYYW